MFRRIRQLLNKSATTEAAGSLRVDQPLVEQFEANPDNPFLISFPRTGSHWLRMMMELYFERPTLVRAFYFPDSTDFLLRHHHDMDLDVERRNVLYLYRDPVATIYSQLRYEQDPLDDREPIAHWSDIYGRHLDKWLVQETFTAHKTILTYEGLKDNLEGEFAKVTDHFGQELDVARLKHTATKVTKGEVKSKTAHDQQVVTLDERYAMSRETFGEQQAAYVWECLLREREHLQQFFKK